MLAMHMTEAKPGGIPSCYFGISSSVYLPRMAPMGVLLPATGPSRFFCFDSNHHESPRVRVSHFVRFLCDID